MRFENLTEEQKDLLRDVSKTAAEIVEATGCGFATVARWRKMLGVKMQRGSKVGKPRPWQIKREMRKCPACSSEFEVTPKSTKNYCSLSCSTKFIDKSYMQTEEYRNSLRKESTPEYQKYRNRVSVLTEKVYAENMDTINPNGYVRGLAGVPGAYHLDHVVPIRYGFDNGMTEEEISSVGNLQMLPWKANVTKGKKLL